MLHFKVFFGAFAVVPAVHGIAFGELAPTGTGPDRALDGVSPQPTKGPSIHELRRRQFDDLSVETCGWVNGDFSSAITCIPGRTCMFYSTFGANMAGCCSGSDTQECGWSNRCINYKEYNAGACDKDCEANSFVWKCSDVASPYCVTWTYPSANIVDYGCATYTRYGVFTVLPRGIDLWDSFSTTITVSTLSGGAVTGWDITTKKDVGTDPATTTTTVNPKETSVPASGSTSSRKTAKKLAISVIIGIAVAGLFLLFIIIVALCCLCQRRKKKSQIAANQHFINTNNRPPSQHSQAPIALEPHHVPPPLPSQSQSGYYSPQGVQEQKYPDAYGWQTPSTPGTPAPQYTQPYYAPPPMPEAPGHYPDKGPKHGTHEVDAWSLPSHPPTAPGQPATPQPVYELGYGR